MRDLMSNGVRRVVRSHESDERIVRRRLKKIWITKAAGRECTNREAAFRLCLSVGHVKALKRKFRRTGDTVFIHGNTGRIPSNKIGDEEKQRILEIKRLRNRAGQMIYEDITFRHFKRKLEENFGVVRSTGAVTKILKEAGYRSIRAHRVKSEAIHERRPAKENMGELLQGDGSEFDWFGDGKRNCIHVLIDDSTNIPTGIYMARHECAFGYNECMAQTVLNYGKPKALYVDGLSVFFEHREPTVEEQLSGEEPETGFARAMRKLRVELIRARSPQGKGRVERFWETAQQILPVEFKERNITTVEEANRFLPEFVRKYSGWFARKTKGSVFTPLKESEKRTLASILSVKEWRTTDRGCVLSLKNYLFRASGHPQERLAVHLSVRDGIYAVTKNGKRVELELFDEDSSGRRMPEVWKDLIEEFFFKDAKAKYRCRKVG